MSLQVCHCGWSKKTSYQGLRTHQGMMGCTAKGVRIPESEQDLWRKQWEESHQNDSRPITSTTVTEENVFMSLNLINAAARQAAVIDVITSLVESQQHSLQMDANLDIADRALGFTTGAQTLPAQPHPAAAETTSKVMDGQAFETPQRSHQNTTSSNKARRALDFSSGAEQARQDRMKADLQQKIHNREQKVTEVRSSVTACKGSLDAEWLEINNVFMEVMKVVEDARQKALQPLEERRHKVKRDAEVLVQKLQREIDMLKKTVDDLDKNPDLQDSPPKGPDESADWKNVNVDTSFSFGTLRTTTSTMTEQIHQKLEKLSSVELKRIPAFAVDVTLDPNTAHQSLDLSDDGKKVSDGSKKPPVHDAPGRFDVFGSVLGLNSLTSGKSYWEVEVSNKTGWDLGVARRDANRKGKLTLKPDNGYWVTVHYEGEKYAALTAPPVSLSLKAKPQKVGVFVDYKEGLVSFYDVTAQTHIYSFTECLFGDKLFPYFSLHLKQNEKNGEPLIISAVQKK